MTRAPEVNAITPIRILLVEDSDTDFLLLQRQLLKRWPASEYARAENRAVLTTMLMQTWDLIISDFHLLDIEGDELLQFLAAHSSAPCLLMSGSIEQLIRIDLPPNIFARISKGDVTKLQEALDARYPPARA